MGSGVTRHVDMTGGYAKIGKCNTIQPCAKNSDLQLKMEVESGKILRKGGGNNGPALGIKDGSIANIQHK